MEDVDPAVLRLVRLGREGLFVQLDQALLVVTHSSPPRWSQAALTLGGSVSSLLEQLPQDEALPVRAAKQAPEVSSGDDRDKRRMAGEQRPSLLVVRGFQVDDAVSVEAMGKKLFEPCL